MFHYAVRFLNKIVEFDSSYPPQQFVASTEKFHDLFGLPGLDGFQVWQQDEIWIPLYGVRDGAPRLFLEAIVEAPEVTSNDMVIGEQLLNHYTAWKRELNRLRNQPIHHERDDFVRVGLQQKMHRIEQGIEMLSGGPLQTIPVKEVFSVMTQWTGSIVRDAQTLHVSVATLKRYKRALRESLGAWSLRTFSDAELQDMFAETMKNVPETKKTGEKNLVKF